MNNLSKILKNMEELNKLLKILDNNNKKIIKKTIKIKKENQQQKLKANSKKLKTLKEYTK